MNPVAIFLILVLLVALWWLIRKRREDLTETQAPAFRPKSTNTQFHAVSITHSGSACKAAVEMAGRRFLATAAPKLPLPDCDSLECKCRFAHHDDRRSNKDRRSPFGPGGSATSTGAFTKERRDGTDRRRRAN